MRVSATNYEEALKLRDDPTLDADLKNELQEELSLYEQAQQSGGVLNTFVGSTGLQALDETGLFPAPAEDDKLVSQQDKFMQKGARSVSKAASRAPEQIQNAPLPANVIEESNKALVGDPVDNALQFKQQLRQKDRETLGLDKRTETNASSSKLDALYRDPEFMPKGRGFWDYANATYYYEPPVSLVQEALKGKYLNDGWTEEAADKAVSSINEDSDEYQRFADALWVETYEQAKAAGKPALRTKYMQDGGWRTQARVQSAVVPFAYGVDRTLTGGAASELTSALFESESNRRARQAEVEASPIATGAGAVVGALAPGGLTGRMYSSLAGGATSGVGRRIAAGVGTGAGESLAADAVHNASEALFTDSPRYRNEADVAAGAGFSGLAGGGGALLGEGVTALARAGVRKMRSGKMGPALRRAEEGGATTGVLRGAEMTPAMKADEAYALQHKIDPEDLMAQNVADPIAAQAMREGRELAEMQAAENALVGPGTKLGKKENPIQPVVTQVRKELDALFDPKTGRVDPLVAKERKELASLLAETVEVRVVPAAQARGAVAAFSGGGRQVKPAELGKLIDQAPELAPMVRQAQRDAMDPSVMRKTRKKTARQALSPEPADIGGARTERDAAAEMMAKLNFPGGRVDVSKFGKDAYVPGKHPTTISTPDNPAVLEGAGSTIRPPPTEANPTMPSPGMPGQYRTKPPNVNVEEPDPGDLLGEADVAGQKVHAVGEVPGHVYVVGPRKMNPERLDRFIKRANKLAEDSEGYEPYQRILAAAMQTRDKFDFPGAAPMRKGDLRLKGLSAKKAEHQMQLEQQMNKQEMAGLPRRDLKPMPEYEAGAGEFPAPMLTGGERAGLTGSISKHGSAGRPEADEAQRRFAEAAGVLPELKQLLAYKSVKELQKAASIRGAIGSRLSPSLYTGQPFSALGLRADPMLRALSGDAPKATPISDALYAVVKKLAGTAKNPAVETKLSDKGTVAALRAGRLNPLATIQGASSRASPRRLAQAAAGGENQRRGHKLTDLSPEEVRVLLRLAAMVQDTERKAASGE